MHFQAHEAREPAQSNRLQWRHSLHISCGSRGEGEGKGRCRHSPVPSNRSQSRPAAIAACVQSAASSTCLPRPFAQRPAKSKQRICTQRMQRRPGIAMSHRNVQSRVSTNEVACYRLERTLWGAEHPISVLGYPPLLKNQNKTKKKNNKSGCEGAESRHLLPRTHPRSALCRNTVKRMCLSPGWRHHR